MTLTGKVIIITGATGGLGPTVVKTMARAGASVVATGLHQEPLDDLLSELSLPEDRALALAGDVTDLDSLATLRDRVLKRFGHIEGLINIAGGYRSGSVLDLDMESWNFTLALNATSVLLACQTIVPHMVQRGYGKVVHGHKNNVAYASAKSAVLRITESLSEEVREHGVNVNAVLPSTIDTPANRKAFPRADHTKWVPPEKLAAVMHFLVSDDASHIHGAAIPVYGLAG